MKAQFREDFDPERDFEAARVFTCNGKEFSPGEPFDRSQVPTRRLRQMFDRRVLRYPGEDGRQMRKPAAPERFGRWRGHTTDHRSSTLRVGARGQETPAPAPEDLPPIPEAWRDMEWFALRAMTAKMFGKTPASKLEAIALFEAEIERRARAA